MIHQIDLFQCEGIKKSKMMRKKYLDVKKTKKSPLERSPALAGRCVN